MAWFLCWLFLSEQSRKGKIETACNSSRERDYSIHSIHCLLWCFLWLCSLQPFNSTAFRWRIVIILASKVANNISTLWRLFVLVFICHGGQFLFNKWCSQISSQILLTIFLEDHWSVYDRSWYVVCYAWCLIFHCNWATLEKVKIIVHLLNLYCSEPLKMAETGASDHALPVGTKGSDKLPVTFKAQQQPCELMLQGCLIANFHRHTELRKVWL